MRRMRAQLAEAMRRALLVGLTCAACSQATAPVVTVPHQPTIYTIPPGVPETDLVCVIIDGPPYEPWARGVRCMTVHELRAWFAAQRKAD